MHYQFFRVRAVDPEQDSATLNAFLATNPVLEVTREFVADGSNSFWSLCVSVAAAEAGPAANKSGKRPSVDYRERLPPEVFSIYARLRALRNHMAKEQDIQPYAIFTNDQLASIAQLSSPSREAIAAIEGIGEKRLEMYVDTFLAELNKPPEPGNG